MMYHKLEVGYIYEMRDFWILIIQVDRDKEQGIFKYFETLQEAEQFRRNAADPEKEK